MKFSESMILCSFLLTVLLFGATSAGIPGMTILPGNHYSPLFSGPWNEIWSKFFPSFTNHEVEQSKTRRGGGGTAGLFAFPRVGRSDPNLSDQTGGYDNTFPTSYEEYDEYPKISEMKRAKMVAFPRVGRSDSQLRNWARMAALQQSLDKRTAPSANSGLWFGPRLGRIQKRSTMDEENKPEQL